MTPQTELHGTIEIPYPNFHPSSREEMEDLKIRIEYLEKEIEKLWSLINVNVLK